MRVVVLALVVSAGCLGSTPGADVPANETRIVTAPDDFASLDADAGDDRWHVHDYWGGKDSLIVMERSHETGFSCSGCTDEFAFTSVRPDPKHVVPQGTAQVVVTVAWTETEGDHGDITLWVKRADQDAMERVAVVASGSTATMNVTNEMDDPPHQVLSLWEFGLGIVPDGDGDHSFFGTIRFLVEAVRGHEIPAYPPHPDLWDGATELPLFSETRDRVLEVQRDDSRSCYGSCLGVHRPGDGVVVPYDAREVVVQLAYGPGLPATLGMRYHGADTWDRAPAEGAAQPAQGATWTIPVTPATADSPYAKQSLWEVEVFLDQPTPARAWTGTYTLTAKAVR